MSICVSVIYCVQHVILTSADRKTKSRTLNDFCMLTFLVLSMGSRLSENNMGAHHFFISYFPFQVQLAEAVLRGPGGAVAGVPGVGRLQLRPGGLRGSGGAAANAGAARRHKAAAV